jgi:hypothetical protein
VTVGVGSSKEVLHLSEIWNLWLHPRSKECIACIALLDELNKGSIAAKLDKHINSATSLRMDAIVIFVGPRPNATESKIDEIENEQRILERQLDEIGLAAQPLLGTWTNQTLPVGLGALWAKRDRLENERNALFAKLPSLLQEQAYELFSSSRTNRGGMYSSGYEQLP